MSSRVVRRSVVYESYRALLIKGLSPQEASTAVAVEAGLVPPEADGPADWLHAGQALQRVLLTATRREVATSLLSQPLDMRAEGDSVPNGSRSPGHIQAIIRFGYGPVVPGTPRRPFPEVLDRT